MVTVRKTQRAKGPRQSQQPDLQRLRASLMQAFPDSASASWRDQDCNAANAAGWNSWLAFTS